MWRDLSLDHLISFYINLKAGALRIYLPTIDIAVLFSRPDIAINAGGLGDPEFLVLNDFTDVVVFVRRNLATGSLLLAVLVFFLHFEVEGVP